MAILDRLIGPALLSSASVSSWRLSDVPGFLFGRSRESSSRQHVDAFTSLSLSAVFAGVRFLSEIMSALPLDVYRKLPSGGKECALTHPAYSILAAEPNPWMTAKTFRQVMEWNRLLGGRACAEIVWTGGGNVAEVWPLEWWRVQEKKDDGLYYLVDGKRRIEPADMIYVPLVTQDGVRGCSFLEYAVESLGLGLSAQQCAALFFGNGSKPGGVLTHKANPTKPQRQELRESWDDTHAGPANKHKVAVLWGGWEYQPNDGTMTPEQSQLLESRRFTVEEVSRWLNIPPHHLSDLTRATFSNIEQQGINFVVNCLTPMLVSYEQEYDRKLLQPPTLYSKHNVMGLMRGDSAAQGAHFKDMFGIGVYSINDICEILDVNPIGPMGDLRFIPVNMMPLEKAQWQAENPEALPPKPPGGPPAGDAPPNADGSGAKDKPKPDPKPMYSQPMRAMLTATFARLMVKEVNAINRAAGKPDSFLSWMDEFYPKHAEVLAEAIAPAASGLPASKAAENAAASAERWCEQSRKELLEVSGAATSKDFPQLMLSSVGKWTGRAPEAAAEFIKDITDATLPA